MHFNTLFHSHVFSQKFLNNNFQFLNNTVIIEISLFDYIIEV